MSKNQNNTGQQVNNSDGMYFKGKKITNDKPLPAYAHADAVNHEMERPLRLADSKRKFNE